MHFFHVCSAYFLSIYTMVLLRFLCNIRYLFSIVSVAVVGKIMQSDSIKCSLMVDMNVLEEMRYWQRRWLEKENNCIYAEMTMKKVNSRSGLVEERQKNDELNHLWYMRVTKKQGDWTSHMKRHFLYNRRDRRRSSVQPNTKTFKKSAAPYKDKEIHKIDMSDKCLSPLFLAALQCLKFQLLFNLIFSQQRNNNKYCLLIVLLYNISTWTENFIYTVWRRHC